MDTRLFHYTTINNLALILKSKKIKFNRMDKINDPTEGLASDFNNFSPYIFIACFTGSQEENLALWNMYTPQMRGVRIEFPLPIFKSFSINGQNGYLFSESEYLNEEQNYFILGGVNEPIEIEYTDDPLKLSPSIQKTITYNNSNYQALNIAKLGICKRKIWSIENEFRYKMEILPIDSDIKTDRFYERFSGLIDKNIYPKIDSYFIEINSTCFEKMKIVMSPKNYPGDEEIICALIEKYSPTSLLETSKLRGLIR
jgi:hypothetical protein